MSELHCRAFRVRNQGLQFAQCLLYVHLLGLDYPPQVGRQAIRAERRRPPRLQRGCSGGQHPGSTAARGSVLWASGSSSCTVAGTGRVKAALALCGEGRYYV